MERELVKIKSDNPAFPNGYFTQFRDCMKPGDVEFIEMKVGTRPDNSAPGIQIGTGDPLIEQTRDIPTAKPKPKKKRK